MNRITTGITYLDRQLNGGLPEGTITSIVSRPASQVNPLLYTFMKDRSWLYVTTYRSKNAVENELDDLLWGDVRVEHVGVDRPVRNCHKILQKVDEPRHVIVDTMNPLEETDREAQYVGLLNGLKEYLLDTGTIALLHCTEHDKPPSARGVTLTMADVVWELELVVEGNTVENRLTVPKYRCRKVVDEVIKLDLGQEVDVDTSKNIA